jgi:hypothetical protein
MKSTKSLTIFIPIILIISIAALFLGINYLASDGAFYGQISQRIIKDQKIVTEVGNLENQSVQYPQLFFVGNAIFTMFLGEFSHRIILFFISIFILALLVKTFWFGKKKNYNLALLVIISAVYFSSSLFYILLRYKIETFLFFYAIVLLYLFCEAEKNYKTLILFSFFIAVQISLKQFGFIFLPFIILFAFWNKDSLKQKLKWLFLSLLIIFLISAPFYVVMKASTGFFTGAPSMRLPYLDDLNIKINGINCGGLCLDSNNLKQPQQEGLSEEQELAMINESAENNKSAANNLERFNRRSLNETSLLSSYNQFKKGSWMLSSLQIAFIIFWMTIIYLFIYFKEYRLQTAFVFLLVIISLIAYVKVAGVWLYWESASFLFEILFLSSIIYFISVLNCKRIQIIALSSILILILISSLTLSYDNIYAKQKLNQQRMEGVLEATNYIPQDSRVLSNRGYEPSYYLKVSIINDKMLSSSFFEKNETMFLSMYGERDIDFILFIKNIANQGVGSEDIRPLFKESLSYFENKSIIKREYENEEVAIYRLAEKS